MFFRQINDRQLSQFAYLIGCQKTGEALIVDPQRDVDRYFALAAEEGLRLCAATETHIHADFLSGANDLARHHGVKVYLSAEGGPDWSYGWTNDRDCDVQLLHHGDTFRVGQIEFRVVFTPGHTPEHLSFIVTDHGGGAETPMGLLSGDFVFVGDVGRPDLLETAAGETGAREPSARALFDSLRHFNELPEHLQVWPGHGAGSACGKALGAIPMSTVGYELRHNVALDAARRGEDAFVASILDGQPEPPAYFGRMKQLNKQGPPPLRRLPQPRNVPAAVLDEWLDDGRMTLIDTRLDSHVFMAGHLPKSLYAPFDASFTTLVGSYVEPNQRLILIIDEPRVEAAVRALVRIGIDRIAGYLTPDNLAAYVRQGGELESTETIETEDLVSRATADDTLVLDVRRASEYQEGSLPGALNIAHTRLQPRLDEIPRGKRLLVHCRSGVRAAAATAFLASQGLDAVWVDGLIEEVIATSSTVDGASASDESSP